MKKNEPEGAFLESIHAAAITIRTILELSTSAVGVRLAESAESHPGAARLEQHRFCQALMLARHGGGRNDGGHPFFLSLPWRSDNGCPTSGHSTFQIAPASDVPP